MLTAQRRQIILERIKAVGQVSVADLSAEWQISEDTVRRDLRDLAEEGLVQRVHGGALLAPVAAGDYGVRETLSPEIKRALGRAAARLVRPGQLVAIDGGTSTLELARALSPDLECTVVTHSPLIAAELRTKPRIEVILIGGRLFRHSMVAVGSETVEAVSRLRVDLFFLGATGLRLDTGATTGDWEEAAVKRALCRASAETVLLVSPEKWDAASPFQIVPAAELTTLVVSDANEAQLAPYRALGIAVVVS